MTCSNEIKSCLRRLSFLSCLLFAILFFCELNSFAQTEASNNDEQISAAEDFDNVQISNELSDGERAVLEMDSRWKDVLKAVDNKDLRLTADILAEIESKKIELGYQSLSKYSLDLIEMATKSYAAGDGESSAFLVRKALQLSPFSSQVLFKSLRLVHLTKSASLSRQFSRALSGLWKDRHVQMLLFRDYIYPLLWSFTIALYLIFVFVFVQHFADLMKNVAFLVPAGYRGIVTPLVVMTILILPLWAGPLWCIAVWGAMCCFWLVEMRRLVLLAAACIFLWAAVIPIRENLDLRMSDKGVQTILRMSSGEYSPDDLKVLRVVVASRPNDAVAWFLFGRALRKAGDLKSASVAFAKADILWHETEPLVKEEKGLLAFLKGDSATARKYFEELEKNGLDSAEFLFNYSKIKFDVLDTEGSRELFSRALKKNREYVESLKSREDALGLRNRNTIAEESIPFPVLFSSVFMPMPGANERHDQLFALLMPFFGQKAAFAASGLLLILFLYAASRDMRRRSVLYSDYKTPASLRKVMLAIPGGAWVLCDKPLKAVFLLGLSIFLLLPYSGWPANSATVVAFLPEFMAYYTSFVILFILGVLYFGYFLSEDIEEE